MAVLGTGLQLLLVGLGAPVLAGAMRQVRAQLEGRQGAGVAQPWRDLRKLWGRQLLDPAGTTIVFRAAPVVLAGSALAVTAVAPLVALRGPLAGSDDLFAVVGLLLLGTVALALGALDTATAFGGMGASRETTIAALVEPTILVAVLALSVRAGSSNLSAIVSAALTRPGQMVSPATALAFVALVVVVVAETGRLPVDNPSTHLEVTMIHEAMTLEYAGRRLAVVEWAAQVRLAVLIGIVVNLFLPWGIAGASTGPAGLVAGMVWLAVKVTVFAVVLAAAEVFLAKFRLFRVPELLAGSLVLALLAVTASSLLAPGAGRLG
ncbi:MAG: respiratory chain complex I subunit 1 family protein [Actinomycetes bacterium]